MALGEWLSVTNARELAEKQIAQEAEELEQTPLAEEHERRTRPHLSSEGAAEGPMPSGLPSRSCRTSAASWYSAARQMIFGCLAAGVTYGIGVALGTTLF